MIILLSGCWRATRALKSAVGYLPDFDIAD
jgi:hypothetical protein